ncbi:MAG: chemotaxis protein CheA [Rhodobacteraceae bacterium PARR1]|nr:MAG: chemotaxis protein CheA [Rhodobacteraceae bacterium PARR1]
MTDDMTAIFRDELRDLLDSLERGLLDLTSNPDDPSLINQVFRDLHTVKGSGAMFGFSELAAFIHNFETFFEHVRSGRLRITPEIIRLSLAARDQIPGLVDGTADPDGQRDAILAAVTALLPGATPVPSEAPKVEADADTAADLHAADEPGSDEPLPDASARLEFRFVGDALGLGAQPEIILDELRALGATGIVAALEDVPTLDALSVDQCLFSWSMDIPASVKESDIEEVFVFAEADWKILREQAADTTSQGHDFNLDAPDVTPPPLADTVMPVAAQAVDPAPALAAVPDHPTAAQMPQAATIRVPAERLDALMDSVGELVIVEARLTELARLSRDPALMTTAEQITRLAAGLRDATMTMRMVPMRSLVARFRRLVMDLSANLGKPVTFSVLGEDTELDKTVIEKLADPLVHILRNALDHGMETVAERAAAGKAADGVVELSAEHSGAEVLIRVRDDGRGMNAERIRAKAIALGMIGADATLTQQQILSLVFEAGFSTAAAVTELSGRGVGMDVVRRTIESLRGQIEIDSALGRGTTVTLRLPLTLAIIEGLLIEVAGEKYTLPMASVHEIVALPPEKSAAKRGSDFLDIRGSFVPFLRLRHLFDCQGDAPSEQNVVIVQSGAARVGIVVDRIVGTNQTVIKQMSKLHSSVRAVSGATILGDGSVALILDVGHLIGNGRVAPSDTAKEAAA